MAGHSKWANIKRRKETVDAKKSKQFAVLSKQITIAAKKGSSGDPEKNPRLRLILDKARSANMPKSNIQKAIDRGLGKGGGEDLVEIIYEGFGPGGIGFLVKAITDNKNRTAAEIKHIFDRHQGSLAGPNAAAYMFTPQEDSFQVKIAVPVNSTVKKQIDNLTTALEAQDDVEYVVHNAK